MTNCVFKYSATPNCPCWGEEIYYAETDQGDVFYTCEGHMTWLMLDSYAENEPRYNPKPAVNQR